MPHSAASDLGLHCLPVTHLGVSSLKWVKNKKNESNLIFFENQVFTWTRKSEPVQRENDLITCDQCRLRLACASVQSDQSLHWLLT